MYGLHPKHFPYDGLDVLLSLMLEFHFVKFFGIWNDTFLNFLFL